MHPATEAILAFNHGRDPERFTRKLDAMAREPFSFFRGTNHLYAASVQREPALLEAPHTYVCGDLHLENFGSFKGDNGLVYFDLNDFDDALLAPLTVDVVRMLSSLMMAASQLGLSAEDARSASEKMLSSYAAVLAQGKPRWLERATAQGMVAELLRRVKRRRRGQLLAQRTEIRKERRRLRIDGRHALPADKAQRKHAATILHAYSQLPHGHRLVADDAARRIAGTGSLGLERYVVLAHEEGMAPVAQRLIDVKLAAPSAWRGMRIRQQPRWKSDAARVVQVQQVMQAASPALLAAVQMDGVSYVVKSLQPTADRVDLGRPNSAEDLRLVLETMAHAAAWAHLRSCRHEAADSIEQLQEFAAGSHWRAPVLRLARHACEVSLSQWRDFADDYRRARQGGRRR